MKNNETGISIKIADEGDLASLGHIAADMQAQHEKNYFRRCLDEQRDKKRLLLVAEAGSPDSAVGYVMLNWQPLYPPFRRLDIPEIQDLNVVPGYRRQGLGAQLVEACEAAARAAGKTEIGIAVGLYARFGAAQRLYVRRGYLPDGAGVCHDDVPVNAGEMKPVDDLLTLKLVKTL